MVIRFPENTPGNFSPPNVTLGNFLGVLHKQIRFHMEKLGQPTLSTVLLIGNLTRQEKG